MAATLFSALYGDATYWDDPDPDYATLLGTVGGAAGTSWPATRDALMNIAARSPVTLAFVVEGDEDFIYIGHSPSIYPADLLDVTPFDNHMVVLVGNDSAAATPVILPPAAFQRTGDIRCEDVATIIGPGGHGAAPAVFRTGPHAVGPTVAELNNRRAMLLPCSDGQAALADHPDGRWSLVAFYNSFVAPNLASADPAVVAKYEPVRDWWRAASTNAAGDASILRVTPVAPGPPNLTTRINGWANRHKEAQLARMGVGGPGLSNAAFAAGVAQIQTTLTDTHADRIQFERDRATKTFAEKHGDALADRLMRFCSVADEANLPEVHSLLVKAPRNREYSVLNGILAERAQASPLPLTSQSAPMATPRLVDEVFRSYQPGGTGLLFGQGLSPFAIVCEGHKEMAEIKSLVKKAELVEGGTSMSVTDAAVFTSSDVRFPTDAFVAGEKLYGWSIGVDVFHGTATAIAQNVRTAVTVIVPCLHRLVAQMADTPAVGMDLVCRIMYELQQDYFQYLSLLASGGGGGAPTFSHIVQKVITYRADSLSPLPNQWYTLIDAPGSRTRGAGAAARQAGTSLRQQSGTIPTTNAHADSRLMQRFRDSEHSSISAMIGARDVDVPSYNGKPVCLTWALKGACSNSCKRKEQHARYGRAVNQKLHQLLDDCGVDNPQP